MYSHVSLEQTVLAEDFAAAVKGAGDAGRRLDVDLKQERSKPHQSLLAG